MVQVSQYSATEPLRDGSQLEIRALRPGDRDGLLTAVGRTSDQSLYKRFFTFKRGFSDQEIDFYINIDFVSHVALVAVQDEDGRPTIVGGARYIVVVPGRAEVAFAVDDAHQRKGIGAALMRHLVEVARQAGVKELIADVLPGNTAMLKVFEASGPSIRIQRQAEVIHVELQLS